MGVNFLGSNLTQRHLVEEVLNIYTRLKKKMKRMTLLNLAFNINKHFEQRQNITILVVYKCFEIILLFKSFSSQFSSGYIAETFAENNHSNLIKIGTTNLIKELEQFKH